MLSLLYAARNFSNGNALVEVTPRISGRFCVQDYYAWLNNPQRRYHSCPCFQDRRRCCFSKQPTSTQNASVEPNPKTNSKSKITCFQRERKSNAMVVFRNVDPGGEPGRLESSGCDVKTIGGDEKKDYSFGKTDTSINWVSSLPNINSRFIMREIYKVKREIRTSLGWAHPDFLPIDLCLCASRVTSLNRTMVLCTEKPKFFASSVVSERSFISLISFSRFYFSL